MATQFAPRPKRRQPGRHNGCSQQWRADALASQIVLNTHSIFDSDLISPVKQTIFCHYFAWASRTHKISDAHVNHRTSYDAFAQTTLIRCSIESCAFFSILDQLYVSNHYKIKRVEDSSSRFANCTQPARHVTVWSWTAHTRKLKLRALRTQLECPLDAKLRWWRLAKQAVALKGLHVAICAINYRQWRQNPAIVRNFANADWCYVADVRRAEHLRYFGAENDRWWMYVRILKSICGW